MSILSDRQIKNLAGKPEVVTRYRNCEPLEYYANPIMVSEEDRIRESAIKQLYDENIHINFRPMISPFVPNQVREQRSWQTQKDMDECFVEIHRYENVLKLINGTEDNAEKAEALKYAEQELASLRRRVEILNMAKPEKIVSYGLSSFGYDIRLAPEYKIASNVSSGIIDPKEPDEKVWVDQQGPSVLIPPNGFMLSRSMEYIRMPKDVLAIVLSKSTYARTGINCLATPLEPGWEGHITLEFANTTPNPVRMYGTEGCCQLIFFKGEECMTPYDQARKYFAQTGITLARI